MIPATAGIFFQTTRRSRTAGTTPQTVIPAQAGILPWRRGKGLLHTRQSCGDQNSFLRSKPEFETLPGPPREETRKRRYRPAMPGGTSLFARRAECGPRLPWRATLLRIPSQGSLPRRIQSGNVIPAQAGILRWRRGTGFPISGSHPAGMASIGAVTRARGAACAGSVRRPAA